VWTTFDTAVDVAIRDSSYKPDPTAKGVWPADKQGYSQIAHSDTAENWAKHQKQWVRNEVIFTAPSDMVSGLGGYDMYCHVCCKDWPGAWAWLG
jgi:hypothetical protein